jgi:tRNA (guanosine-2'-O-)-methyltransferase
VKHFEPYAFRREHESLVPPHRLDHLMSERRRSRFRQVLARRTTRLTVAVDNCYDAHNASAVIRTCDAFGVHRINVVTSRNAFKVNRKITQGAHLYTDLRVYNAIATLYRDLRAGGYRILVADLAADAVLDPHNLAAELERTPLALVFGNEEGGSSEEALAAADGRFLIPMSGFTQSLNLSVSVAITLFSIRHQTLAVDGVGDMTAEEQRFWYDHWLQRLQARSGEQPFEGLDVYQRLSPPSDQEGGGAGASSSQERPAGPDSATRDQL